MNTGVRQQGVVCLSMCFCGTTVAFLLHRMVCCARPRQFGVTLSMARGCMLPAAARHIGGTSKIDEQHHHSPYRREVSPSDLNNTATVEVEAQV